MTFSIFTLLSLIVAADIWLLLIEQGEMNTIDPGFSNSFTYSSSSLTILIWFGVYFIWYTAVCVCVCGRGEGGTLRCGLWLGASTWSLHRDFKSKIFVYWKTTTLRAVENIHAKSSLGVGTEHPLVAIEAYKTFSIRNVIKLVFLNTSFSFASFHL